MIISCLKDLVKYFGNLQIKVIKLTGDAAGNVKVQAVESETKSVVISGKFTKKIPEFEGVIGLSDLKILESLVNIYSDPNDTIEVVRETRSYTVEELDDNGDKVLNPDGTPSMVMETEDVVSGFTFKRPKPYMKNPYRTMDKRVIPQQFDPKQITWDISFKPTSTGIKLFDIQSTLCQSKVFTFEHRGTDFLLKFDDAEIIFADNVPAKLTTARYWKSDIVQTLLKLSEKAVCEMSFNDNKGAIKIKLETGLGVYEYIIPALSNIRK